MPALLGAPRYAAADARVRARGARLLGREQWRQVISARGPGGVVSALRDSGYGEALAGVDSRHPDLVEVERILRSVLARSWHLPVRFVQGRTRKLLQWRWRRFEVENLKTVLRAVGGDGALVDAGRRLLRLPASRVSWAELAEVSSVSSVEGLLGDGAAASFYGRILEEASDRYRETGDIAVLEVALDLAWWRRLLRLAIRLTGDDRVHALRFVGSEADAFNVAWAFRMRVFLNLPPEEILLHTLHRHVRADAGIVRRIADGAAPAEIASALWGDRLPGADRLAELDDRQAVLELESALQRHLLALAVGSRAGFSMNLGGILAFQTVVENEVRDLVTVLEAKVGDLDEERVVRHLIGDRL